MLNTLIGLCAGAIFSILVSRYYFIRGIKYHLSVYLHDYSQILAGLDQDVVDAVTIKFEGLDIEELSDMVFLVANDGSHPIRGIIEPFTIVLPKGSTLLDASFQHVHPEGRRVSVAINKQPDRDTALCTFDLLNKGDYFLVKLLLDGYVGEEAIVFKIAAEGLPPTLELSHASYSTDSSSRWIDTPTFLSGLILASMSTSVLYLIQLVSQARPGLLVWWPWELQGTREAWLANGAVVVAAVVALSLGGVGIGMILTGISKATWKQRTRFVLPERLRRSSDFEE